jgi:hypothetical protein
MISKSDSRRLFPPEWHGPALYISALPVLTGVQGRLFIMQAMPALTMASGTG